MDISKLFAKKRDLNDQSNNGNKQSQLWEESSSCSGSPNTDGEVFQENLKSTDCMKILLNCLENRDKKVIELYNPA